MMGRRPFIAGNWKMNTELGTALELLRGVREAYKGLTDRDVMVAPPFPFLMAAKEELRGSNVILAAQNMHHLPKGPYTGEVSYPMLLSLGVSHVILGHSERREHFKEEDGVINLKVKAALENGLVPILCVGEKLKEREKGLTLEVIGNQLRNGLLHLETRIKDPDSIIIAYEPVWAIGTGKTATPVQAQEVHRFIRDLLGELLGTLAAEGIRILYGGSVTPENIDQLMAEPDIDGALVGGASLELEKFKRIMYFEKGK